MQDGASGQKLCEVLGSSEPLYLELTSRLAEPKAAC